MLFDIYLDWVKNIIFICLFSSTLCYWFSLNFTNSKLFYISARITASLANLVLVIFLSERWINSGYFPLSNLYESLLFLSSVLIFVYQILEYRTESKFFGALVLPIILFITSFADLTLPLEMQKTSALVPALQSNWLVMHVSLMMLSYATLLLGSIFSIIFLLISFFPQKQNSKINLEIEGNFQKPINYYESANPQTDVTLIYKNLNEYESFSVPIYNQKINNTKEELLKNLDNWSYRSISLGFPFLTIGIIAGSVWANEAWGSYWSWDPKETWALITWLVFAAYLHVRLVIGWAGKGPAILASIGFFVVWVCYLGVNFLGQGLHSYGWLT